MNEQMNDRPCLLIPSSSAVGIALELLAPAPTPPGEFFGEDPAADFAAYSALSLASSSCHVCSPSRKGTTSS